MTQSPGFSADSSDRWQAAAVFVMGTPASPCECPDCGAKAVSGAWHLTDCLSRQATIDLTCTSCKTKQTLSLVLPPEVLPFYPLQRASMLQDAIKRQTESIAGQIRLHADAMPVAAFTTSPVWEQAKWRGTTFRWNTPESRNSRNPRNSDHPRTGPPIMGLCFDNANAGRKLFSQLVDYQGQLDEHEEIRISIIEGSPPGQPLGYSVHLCPDPESLAAYATAAGIVLDPKLIRFFGRWNRMYPVSSHPSLLEAFKKGFAQHKEFMLTSATRRDDGQEYFDVQLGLVKHKIEFRRLADITTDDDPDAMALLMPALVPATHGSRSCLEDTELIPSPIQSPNFKFKV